MKPIVLSGFPSHSASLDEKVNWLLTFARKVENASRDETTKIADAYQTSHVTTKRTLDPTTAVLADVANVLCTYLIDEQKRGVNNKNG